MVQQIDGNLNLDEVDIRFRFKREDENGQQKGVLLKCLGSQDDSFEKFFTTLPSLFLFLEPLLSTMGLAYVEDSPSLERRVRPFWERVKWSLLFLGRTYSDFHGLYKIFPWDESFRCEILRRVRYCEVEWTDLFEEIYEGFWGLQEPVDTEWWEATLDLCRTLRDPKYLFFWEKFLGELEYREDHPVVKGMHEIAWDVYRELYATLDPEEVDRTRASIPMSAPGEWIPLYLVGRVLVQPSIST